MLLLAHHPRHAVAPVGGQRVGRMLEQPRAAAGRHRRHRRRQVDQPLRGDREPAHHLQRGRRVLFRDRDPPAQPGLDPPPAEYVGDVEQAAGLVRRSGRSGGRGPGGRAGLSRRAAVGHQRAGRLVVHAPGRDGHQFPLRIAQRGQPAAEHAAGIDTDGVIDPNGHGDRRVTVDHGRLAPVVLRPRVADRQPEFVRLPGGFPVQRERPDRSRGAAVHFLPQARMGDHQPPAVQHVVADQAVQEGDHLGPELLRRGLQLRQRLGQAMGDLDVAAAQRPQQLALVVAGNAQRGAGRGHRQHRGEHARRVRAAVDQVTEEHRGPARRMPPSAIGGGPVAERVQQVGQFPVAAVHVADDVKRPVLAGPVGPGRLPDHLRGVHLGRAGEDEHAAESLPLQPPDRAREHRVLPGDHPGSEAAVGPRRVPLDAGPLADIEHDRHRQHMMLAGQRHQRPPRVRLHVRGVDHGQPPDGEPLGGDHVQRLEGRRGHRLVVLVVADQAAEEVRGQHLGRPEVPGGEG